MPRRPICSAKYIVQYNKRGPQGSFGVFPGHISTRDMPWKHTKAIPNRSGDHAQ